MLLFYLTSPFFLATCSEHETWLFAKLDEYTTKNVIRIYPYARDIVNDLRELIRSSKGDAAKFDLDKAIDVTRKQCEGGKKAATALDDAWGSYQTCWRIHHEVAALFEVDLKSHGAWGSFFETGLDKQHADIASAIVDVTLLQAARVKVKPGMPPKA